MKAPLLWILLAAVLGLVVVAAYDGRLSFGPTRAAPDTSASRPPTVSQPIESRPAPVTPTVTDQQTWTNEAAMQLLRTKFPGTIEAAGGFWLKVIPDGNPRLRMYFPEPTPLMGGPYIDEQGTANIGETSLLVIMCGPDTPPEVGLLESVDSSDSGVGLYLGYGRKGETPEWTSWVKRGTLLEPFNPNTAIYKIVHSSHYFDMNEQNVWIVGFQIDGLNLADMASTCNIPLLH